MLQIETKRV